MSMQQNALLKGGGLNHKKIKPLMETYKNNPYFNAMNELKIDFTEYAKTL